MGEPEDELAPRAVATPNSLHDAFWAVVSLDDPVKLCPELDLQHWAREGDRMFTDATPGLSALETDPIDLPDPLRGFCLYRWVGPVGAPALPVHGSIRHVSLDWAVVEQLDNGLDEAYRPALRDVFLSQAGRLSAEAPSGTFPVTVAVVDSEPESEEPMPYIEHASAMADVIETLACGGKDECLVQTYRALALPLLDDGEVREQGGFYGTRAHVAMGIVESVLAWRKTVTAGKNSRLVVNLSLGWVTSGMAACGAGESEPWCEAGTNHVGELVHWLGSAAPLGYSGQVADESVHAALLYATCNGALVVTAAGNGREDSCNEAPMAPAIWSRYSSPSAQECMDLGFEAPVELDGVLHDADRPLVQPVSAVDHTDGPIYVTRPESETRLVAPGHFVTTGMHMEPLTGTSLSAAVVSAGAAMQWTYDPLPSPGSVVDRLYDTGTSVGRNSELLEYGWGAEVPMRRLSLCRAADPACEGQECASLYCAPEDSVSMNVGDLHTQADLQLGQMVTIDAATTGLLTDTCWSCNEPVTAMVPSTSTPQDFYFFSSCNTSPNAFIPHEGPTLAGPQPEDPPCPDCPVVAADDDDESAAILALDSWYWGANITGATLTLRRQGNPTTVLDLSTTPNLIDNLQQGMTVRLTLPGVWHSTNEPLRQASFGVQIDSGGIQHFRSNELLVIHPS